VNLLLLDRDEIGGDGIASLDDDRARHLVQVLQVGIGQRIRAGIVDGPIGDAEVLAVEGASVRLRVDCTLPSPPSGDVLLLAVPRPKVLRRSLELAAALGFSRIVLFRSWRVDKSHLGSRALDPAVQRQHLRAGLAQARRTAMPEVRLFRRFRPFVEDELPHLSLPQHRFCAHPAALVRTAELRLSRQQPFALALGPEGGLLPYEVDRFAAGGFLPVRMSSHPLRTENALAGLHAQLDLLRRCQ